MQADSSCWSARCVLQELEESSKARSFGSDMAEYQSSYDLTQGANTVSLSLQAGSMTSVINLYLCRLGRFSIFFVELVGRKWKPCERPCPAFESLPLLPGGAAARLHRYREAPSRAGGGSVMSCSGPVDPAAS